MTKIHSGASWRVMSVALVTLLVGVSAVVGAPCTFCDYDDGSCCECSTLSADATLPCPCVCGPVQQPQGATCQGYQGPCRKRDGSCVWGWDKLCCEAIGGHIDLSCLAEISSESTDNVTATEQPTEAERPAGLVAVLMVLAVLPILALRFGARR